MTRGVVIVGGSVAGTRVARALREYGYREPVTVLEAESHVPYDKPPLSKAALGETRFAPVTLLTAAGAADLGIDLQLGTRAARLDTEAAVVHTTDGQEFPYDELVISTGVGARPSPWGHPDGVHVLRTMDDARAVRKALDHGGDIAIIGAGFIGSEVASAARARGLGVTMIDPLALPMARLLGEELGRRLAELHQRHGVKTRFGARVIAIDGAAPELRVRLDDGSVVPAASVVVGIGTTLSTGWLEGSGLPVDDGVVCDEYCRVQGHGNIYAVGDVARWLHPRHSRSVRTEHWTNAIEQAACVAGNLAMPDQRRPHDPVEYVWSDQYDWKMHLLGQPEPLTEPTVIEDAVTGRLAAVWTSTEDEVTGGFTVNWSKASVMLRRAIRGGGSATDLIGMLLPAAEVGR